MRPQLPGSPYPRQKAGEHTATTFQLSHDPDFPVPTRCTYAVGDKVITPMGKGEITWLNEETGKCLALISTALEST